MSRFINHLIAFFVPSPCCGAKLYQPVGWARLYCSNCEERVR
jgi:hypothetical protein